MESQFENHSNTPNKSEAESDFFEDEINPNLLKILEKNAEKINTISTLINTSEIIGFIFLFVFLLLLTIRLSVNFNFSWLFLLIPVLITTISFTFQMNLYLKLKDIFTEGFQAEEKKTNSLGSNLSYFCVNAGSLCLIIYFILFSLKLDNITKMNLNEVSIPFYILMGILIFYYIFIFPAFLKNKMLLELFIIGLYLISFFLFIFLINLKIDSQSSVQYFYLAFSLLFVMVLNIAYYIYSIISNRNDIINDVTNLVSILLLFNSIIITCLKLDKVIFLENWIPLTLMIFSYLIFISDKIFMLFESKNMEDAASSNENDEKALKENF
jgi:hypothetical protein